MLSRIAESLFWLGRYVERADDTARVLDAFMHRLLDDPGTDEEAACRTLFAVLGVAVPATESGVCDAQTVLDVLAFDAREASSVVGAWQAAHDNARGVREVISTESWECLNATRLALPAQRRAAGRLGPYAYLRYVRERAALFSGLADSTMSRDDSWLFLTLGRSLERVDMTARLLSVKVLASPYAPDWVTLLRAAGADEPYRITESWGGDPQSAARFLVLDPGFPRSIVHALATAERCLADVADATTGRSSQGRVPRRSRGQALAPSATRIVGRMRTVLEYLDADTLVERLPTVLKELQEACLAASRQIADQYFQYGTPVVWLQGKDS
ncbi:putative alpha-E superfamily protein [Catenulispora sp. GAS73]|uniref:alpha-E domain-containing protein n=1 Tax=Catenulispora sp. GAS73 TaxID=3156269 RepID=UPI003514E215